MAGSKILQDDTGMYIIVNIYIYKIIYIYMIVYKAYVIIIIIIVYGTYFEYDCIERINIVHNGNGVEHSMKQIDGWMDGWIGR